MKNRRKLTLTIVGIILALCALSGVGLLMYVSGTSGSLPEEGLRLNIPAGHAREVITSQLPASYSGRVLMSLRLLGADTDAVHGSYVVSPDMAAWRLARRMQTHRQTPVRLTFTNLRTLGSVVSLVASRIEADSAAVFAAMDSVLSARGFRGAAQYPAAFLPDTYEFYWTDSPARVISRMADHRDAFWTPDRRRKAADLGLNPVKVATVASIVEEETAKTDERPAVARLYLNRIARGMKLQADPTVKFDLGDFGIRRLTIPLINRATGPYNTYRIAGLPPGPIRFVQSATLDAVLDAPRHDYLYMCARSDFSGYHAFATDAATHAANARAYHRALNARNIH